MAEAQQDIKCSSCGCVVHEGMATCPLCGADLGGAQLLEGPPTFAEHVRSQWADKRTRTILIAVAVVLVCMFIGAVVYSLVQDALLKEHARAVAEGETMLVQGSTPTAQGTCSLRTSTQWFFADADQLSVVKNRPEGGWALERSGDGGATWSVSLTGSGVLLSAGLVGNKLFYSLSEDGMASTLRSESATGEFSEYPSASSVVALAATEEMVVTKSAAGKIGWLNVGSGIWHDLQGQLELVTGRSDVRIDEIRAFGAQAIASTDDGQVIVIDVNSDDAYIAGVQEG